jgi:thiol-disulfide isomerase/thioredoxin
MKRSSFYFLLVASLCSLWLSTAHAQQTVPSVAGSQLDGKPFALNQSRGKVSVLVFWTTDCAVCRDKMPEFRNYAKQWKTRPFQTVLINMDKRMKDIDDYNKFVNSAIPMQERLPQLWALAPDYTDNLGTMDTIKDQVGTELPLVYVIDKAGKVVARHQGRFDVQVWQDIAKLL